MDKSRQTEILYQFSLSIGTSLSLDKMLKHSLTTLMRGINLNIVQVLNYEVLSDFDRNDSKNIVWKNCFSIPLIIQKNSEFDNFKASLELPETITELDRWKVKTPFSLKRGLHSYYILNLPEFGIIILRKSGKTLNSDILQSLQALMAKLAGAALACIKHQMLQHQIKEVQLKEKKLKQSEKYNRLLIDSIPDLIFVLTGEGVFENVHADGKQLFLSENAFIGKDFRDILPHDTAQKLEQNLAKLFLTSHPQIFSYSLSINDTIKEFECILNQIDSKRALALSRDITERRKAEEALKDSEEKFRQVTESMDEVFWLRSSDNTEMLYVSPAYEKIWGRTVQSLYENPLSFIDSIYVDDITMVTEKFTSYMRTGKFSCEYRIQKPDGDIRWLRARSFQVKDRQGNVIRHSGIASDITDQKNMQMALKRHDEIETMLAKLSTSFINVKADEMDITITNALASIGKKIEVDRVYVFSYTQDLLFCSNTHEWCNESIEPQQHMLQNVPCDSMPWWTEKMNNLQNIVLNSIEELPQNAVAEREILEPQKIKSLLVVPLSIEEKVHGFIGFDSVINYKNWTHEEIAPLELLATMIVAARRRMEDERKLRELNASLEQKVEQRTRKLNQVQSQLYLQDKMGAIGQLAAGLAHEINNPVSFVSTNFFYLQESLGYIIEILNSYRKHASVCAEKSEELKQQYDHLIKLENDMMLAQTLDDLPNLFTETRSGFKRITEIINSMRSFARSDVQTDFSQYDLKEGIKETLVLARNAYKYKAELELDLSDLPLISANPGQINQVLLNIVVNAAQALEEHISQEKHGLIKILTWHDPINVYCEISDNGPGIPDEISAKIFDPFFSTKNPGKGTGLGLSISYDIITNIHKGQLSVSKSTSGGSAFLIVLPIEQDQQQGDFQ